MSVDKTLVSCTVEPGGHRHQLSESSQYRITGDDVGINRSWLALYDVKSARWRLAETR